jgi:hypothetical protein
MLMTGTPSGLGAAFKPPKFLKLDVVKTEVKDRNIESVMCD